MISSRPGRDWLQSSSPVIGLYRYQSELSVSWLVRVLCDAAPWSARPLRMSVMFLWSDCESCPKISLKNTPLSNEPSHPEAPAPTGATNSPLHRQKHPEPPQNPESQSVSAPRGPARRGGSRWSLHRRRRSRRAGYWCPPSWTLKTSWKR